MLIFQEKLKCKKEKKNFSIILITFEFKSNRNFCIATKDTLKNCFLWRLNILYKFRLQVNRTKFPKVTQSQSKCQFRHVEPFTTQLSQLSKDIFALKRRHQAKEKKKKSIIFSLTRFFFLSSRYGYHRHKKTYINHEN